MSCRPSPINYLRKKLQPYRRQVVHWQRFYSQNGYRLQSYGIAIVAVAIALLLQWQLFPLTGNASAFLLFLAAATIAAWHGGLKSGLVATLLGSLVSIYFFFPPAYDLSIKTSGGQLQLGLYLAIGVQISWLTEQLHKAKRQSAVMAQAVQNYRQSLIETEELFGSLVEGVKEYAIFTLDRSGRVVSWNKGAERIKGYRSEEIIGQNFCRFYTQEDIQQDQPETGLKIATATGSFANRGWRLRQDGSRFWADVRITALRDKAGNLTGFSQVISDISESLRYATLRKSAEAEFAQLLAREQAASAVAVSATNMVERLQAVTDVALAHLSLDDLLRESLNRISEILAVDTAVILLTEPDLQSLLVRSAKGLEEEVEGEFHIPIGQGFAGRIALECKPLLIEHDAYRQVHSPLLEKKHIQSLMGVPLLVGDRVLGVVRIGTIEYRHFTQEDMHLLQLVAERVALAIDRANLYEAEQKARNQAEAASRIKDEFLAIVSHELRTPLNSILGWAQTLRTRHLNEAIATKALETIERNAKQQVKLIDDILDVSRIIGGKLRLTLIPLSLLPILETAVENLKPAAAAKGIQLELSVLDPSTGKVSGDLNRLQQVVSNLIANAIKFTTEGGKVQIQLSAVMENGEAEEQRSKEDRHPLISPFASPASCPAPYAQITVSDNGIGISADFLPHVFDGFRQADSSTTRNYDGLGLGLTIVRYLVDLHGGTVTAASDGEGKGATFIVRLPLIVPNEQKTITQSNCSKKSIQNFSSCSSEHSKIRNAGLERWGDGYGDWDWGLGTGNYELRITTNH